MALVTADPAQVSPAAPVRSKVVFVGSVFASLASVMLFAGLIGMYLSLRQTAIADGQAWLPSGVKIPLPQANMMMFTLLLSCVVAQWARDAVRKNDRQSAYLAFGLTLLLGIAFLNQSIYLFSVMKLTVTSGTVMSLLFYTIVGAHLIMVVGALFFFAFTTIRVLGGQYNRVQHDGVSAAVLYWYVTVAVFAVIWYAIYVTK